MPKGKTRSSVLPLGIGRCAARKSAVAGRNRLACGVHLLPKAVELSDGKVSIPE